MRVSDLAPHLLGDARIVGDPSAEVRNLRAYFALDRFGPDELTYVTAARVASVEALRVHPARAFITDFAADPSALGDKVLIVTSRPRLQMARVSHLFARPTMYFGEGPAEGSAPRIGVGARVHPTAWLDRDVVIGAGTVIHAHVTLYRGVTIGERGLVHSGAVLGAEGFGYERDDDGSWFRIAHLGGVVIGDDVEIGANTCVDRGTLGDTRIDDGAKIDNLVHVAHNVHIGRHAMVIANSMLGGSSVVGDGAYLAPSATIRDGRTIGAGATVGLGAVVTRDVPPGITVMGVPARPRES